MSREMLLYLASLTFRSLCIGALAGLVTFRMRSVAARHSVWVAVLLTTLLLPVADAILPAAFVPGPVQQLPALTLFEPAAGISIATGTLHEDWATAPMVESQWWSLAAILYVCVFLALFFRLALAYRNVANLRRSSRVVTIPEIRTVAAAHRLSLVPDVRESDALCVPLTVGFADPSVIVPADWRRWDAWKLFAVLSHELAHIRRSDWAMTVLASLNKCVFWFNPLSWWIERQLSILSEKSSDEASIAITGDAVRYAEVLLQFAAAAQTGQRLQAGGVAMARTNMRSRIDRVLTMRRPGTGILTRTRWILVLALSTPILYAAAALHVTPESLVAPSLSMPLPPPVTETEKPAVAVERSVVGNHPAPKTATVQAEPAQMKLTLVRKALPIYPPLAKQARIQGVVFVSVLVGEDGRVIDATIISGHPVLQQSAVDSVRQWLYEPPIVNGRPGRAVTTEQVNFSFVEAGFAEPDTHTTEPVPPRPSLPPPPPGVQRVRLAGADLKVLQRVEPVYPAEAREIRIQGVAILEVVVGLDGRAKMVRIISGHPLFQQSAIDAVSQWRFEVTTLNGEPVEAVSTITLNFTQSNGNATVTDAPRPAPSTAPATEIAVASRAGTILFIGDGSFSLTEDGNLHSKTATVVQVLPQLQRCQGCTIHFRENGGIVSATQPGMGRLDVRLAADGNELELTALSRECSITTVLPTGSTFVTSLSPGKSTRVSPSAQITVTCGK